MSKQLPLIVVLGATACGKSKLAIDLARRFSGEIISADSMQVYTGLDIVTNKVSEEEQIQAKHHMINIWDPSQRCSVVDFRNRSLDIISRLYKNSSLPIIVGGTNYYIESLLWKSLLIDSQDDSLKRKSIRDSSNATKECSTLLDSEAKLLENLSEGDLHSEDDLKDVEKFFKKPIYNEAFKHVDSEKLWQILEKVDPKSAHFYHPNDKRRVIRCLQIIQGKGKSYSELLKELNKSEITGESSLGGSLRFKDTCVLWLSCESEVLDRILDERVEQMMNRGLLAELENFHDSYNRKRPSISETPNYEKGIFQTIGFKEFHRYLMLEPEAKDSDEGNKILRDSIEAMKVSTRQYAKRQLKWIRRRFLQAGTRDLPPLFKLETSFDEEGWQEQVRQPAFEIVERLIAGQPLNDTLLSFKQEAQEQSVINTPEKYNCEACERVYIGSHQIQIHLASRSHERKVSRMKRGRMLEQSEGE